jgi:murein DD-endopeptidase MepM/ murein hydrolase activator NlpD
MRSPFAARTITSPFGPRRDPNTGRKSHHNGVDFGVPGGVWITAPAACTVIGKQNSRPYGHLVELDLGDGVIVKFKHLREPADVKVGQQLDAGDKIGRVGHTGTTARGDHLHMETWVDGTVVDPLGLIE